MQDNTQDSTGLPKPDADSTQNNTPPSPIIPTVTPVQPSMNASVASAVYPEPTKGFMGSIAAPELENTPAPTTGGGMMLFVAAFTISLTLILSIVANIAGLLEVVFNHIGSTKDAAASTYTYLGLDSYELKIMLWLVSSLLISTGIYVGLLIYMRKNESLELNSFSTKVYGFVYGGFLTILGLATVSSFGNFVYSCLVPLVPKGAYDSEGVSWWVGVVQALLTTLLLAFVSFYYFKKAKSSSRLS